MRTRQDTCEFCGREFTKRQSKKRGRFHGTCPHCGTYDNGSSNSRFTTSHEREHCRKNGHDWKSQGDRWVCSTCGHWETTRVVDGVEYLVEQRDDSYVEVTE